MMFSDEQKKIAYNFKNCLAKNWLLVTISLFVFVFDVSVMLLANNYFSHPFINRDYIRENGYTTSLVCNGWALVNGHYYYCDENAIIVSDKIVDIDGKQYYFNQDGILVTNIKNYSIDNVAYDIDKNGVISIASK